MFPVDLTRVMEILSAVKNAPSETLESETIEFKGNRDVAALHDAKNLAEEVSAMANKSGGAIVVGVLNNTSVRMGDWLSQLVGFPPVDVTELMARISGRLKWRMTIPVQNLSFEAKNYVGG